MIVPWAAGGDTDNIFRPLAPLLQKHLGQPVVIANVTRRLRHGRRARGQGLAGRRLHHLCHARLHPPRALLGPHRHQLQGLRADLPGVGDAVGADREPEDAVEGLGRSSWPTPRSGPARSRSAPRWARPATSSPPSIEKAAGIKLKYVSYEGLAPRMNAILGGHIDLTDSNLTQKGKVDAGQLKFLAIATEQRDPEMPNVPTLKELGSTSSTRWCAAWWCRRARRRRCAPSWSRPAARPPPSRRSRTP